MQFCSKSDVKWLGQKYPKREKRASHLNMCSTRNVLINAVKISFFYLLSGFFIYIHVQDFFLVLYFFHFTTASFKKKKAILLYKFQSNPVIQDRHYYWARKWLMMMVSTEAHINLNGGSVGKGTVETVLQTDVPCSSISWSKKPLHSYVWSIE
jgi:hypothetical protein